MPVELIDLINTACNLIIVGFEFVRTMCGRYRKKNEEKREGAKLDPPFSVLSPFLRQEVLFTHTYNYDIVTLLHQSSIEIPVLIRSKRVRC